MNGMPSGEIGNQGEMTPSNQDQTQGGNPQIPTSQNEEGMEDRQNGNKSNTENPPERPDGSSQNGEIPPEKPDGEMQTNMQENLNAQNTRNNEASIEFTITAQTHTFNNVSNYTENSQAGTNGATQVSQEQSDSSDTSNTKSDESNTTTSGKLPNTGSNVAKIVTALTLLIACCTIFYKKYRHMEF